ncbi:MAG: DUF5808 domain-containing protein [Acidobacteriota bacterium]
MLLTLLIAGAFPTVVMVATALALPHWSHRGLFFGVTVGAEFAPTSEGRAILRGYRGTVAATGLLALAMAAGGALNLPWLSLAAPFVAAAGVLVGYLRAHHAALAHSIAPVTVREASLQVRREGLPGSIYGQGLPFLILASASLYAAHHWDELPARIPIHFDAQGAPNGWAAKGLFSVFGGAGFTALLCLLMLLFSYTLLRCSRPGTTGASSGTLRRVFLKGLLACEFLLALVGACITAMPFVTSPQGRQRITLLVIVAAMAFPLVLLTYLGIVASRAMGRGATVEAGRPPSRGDGTPDSCWKKGMFYVNRDDPALWVPKRFGIGYTLNFGHRGAWVILGILLAIALAGLILPFLAS